MLKLPNLSRPLTIILLAAALGSVACKTQVVGGGDGGGGDAGGSGGVGGNVGGSGGVGGAVATTAIAEYASMAFPPGGTGGASSSGGSGGTGGTTSSSSTGGPGVDPNTLYVRIGNYGPACGSSMPYTCDPEAVWQISIGLPPYKQAAGGVYSLGDADIISTFSESGSNGSPGDCWGGGGSFTSGTVEILGNDGLTITVRLSGTNGGLLDVSDTDGDYAAPICQWGLD